MRALCIVGSLVALCFATALPALATVPLTTCGQVAATGGVVLTGDLDCSSTSEFSAVVIVRGTLDLNGFTLTAPSGGVSVQCNASCRVIGPGTLVGGVFAPGLGRRMSFRDVTMTGSGGVAFHYPDVRLVRTTVTGFDTGMSDIDSIKLIDSTLAGSGAPGRGVATGFGYAKLKRSSITGFGDRGIQAYRVRLIDSTVVGNGNSPACSGFCGDLLSDTLPIVKGTSSCGTSWSPNTNVPWGVCAND